MAALKCSSCGHDNPPDSQFCQKCGNRLLPVCKRCGAENVIEAEFCKKCGTKLSEARFALSPADVAKWRRILGGIDGWSPAFKAGAKTLAVWEKLTPPLIPDKEPFIFDVEITGRMLEARGQFKVGFVTIQGKRVVFEQTFLGYRRAYLLATESRLVAYIPEKETALQIPYDQIVSLSVERDHYILGLRDGTKADIHTMISRAGLLGAMAVIGAPPEAKGHIVDLEKSKARDAESFVAAFTQFFMEIIEENRRRER